MIPTLHVLSIGSIESNDFVRDVLLSRAKCQLFAAASVRDLSVILEPSKFDVAILHDTVSAAELRNCSVYIRHHWPNTRILLIHADAEILDDPMYDERMRPGSSTQALLAMIEQLAVCVLRGADMRRTEGARND